MASDRPTDRTVRPAGAEGDGMDPYPTYRDGPVPPHAATGAKPTDVGLPRSRRTYALPILIGLIVFALVIIIRIVWGGMNMASTTEEALTPGDPAAPAVGGAAPAGSAAAPVPVGEEQPQTSTGPAEIGPAPGASDVPGGATATPPAQ